MKKTSLPLWGLINSAATLAYVIIVALVLNNSEKIFPKEDHFLTPVAFLILFILSALITGLLVLGRPIYLFLEGQKKEAVKLLLITAGWLFLLLIMLFALIIVAR